MNSPEEILKMQRSLSVASGTKKLASWLLIVAMVLAVVSFVVALRSKGPLVGSVASPLGLMMIFALLRSSSERRIREIMSVLHQ